MLLTDFFLTSSCHKHGLSEHYSSKFIAEVGKHIKSLQQSDLTACIYEAKKDLKWNADAENIMLQRKRTKSPQNATQINQLKPH
jgi:hypothetical protein